MILIERAVVYQTDLYGGSDADLDNTAAVDNTDGYTDGISVDIGEYAAVDFKFTGSGNTDTLELKLFRTIAASHDGDEIAIDAVSAANDSSEDIYSYTIGPSHGPGNYRFSMQSSGGTDTFDIEVKMSLFR